MQKENESSKEGEQEERPDSFFGLVTHLIYDLPRWVRIPVILIVLLVGAAWLVVPEDARTRYYEKFETWLSSEEPAVEASGPGSESPEPQPTHWVAHFERIEVIQDMEDGAGEATFTFTVNGEERVWPGGGQEVEINSGDSVKVGLEVPFTLEDGASVSVSVVGVEHDDRNTDDPLGHIARSFESSDLPARGLSAKSPSPTSRQGQFEVFFEIRPGIE